MSTPYGLGAHASPPDERDYQALTLLASTAPVLPGRYVARNPGAVLDQAKTPECVTFSTCGALRHELHARGYGWLDLDEDELYREAKQLDGQPNADGTNYRTVFDIIRRSGVPLRDGTRFTVPGFAYYSVPVDYETIKQAIYQLGEVLLAAMWPQSWFSPYRNGVVPAPDSIAGGHAFRGFGWDDRRMFHAPSEDSLIDRNSWSAGWGMKGSFYLPKAYFANVIEAWRLEVATK